MTPSRTVILTEKDFHDAWNLLDSGKIVKEDASIELVALGNPHLSFEECKKLAMMVDSGAPKHPDVRVVATMGREIFAKAEEAGFTDTMKEFGVEFINDTCWC